MTLTMAAPSPRTSRAAWTQTATYVDPADATPAMLTIGQLAERTGLTFTAIHSAIAHPRDHAGQRAALRLIAQPRWNVGGEPRWDQKAIKAYFAVTAAMRSTDAAWAHLPRITAEDAVRAQLASLSGMGSRGPCIGKTNFDRWKKWVGQYIDAESGKTVEVPFPEPVARIDRGGPSPMLLYPWRTSECLRPVLEDGLLALHGEIDEVWLARVLAQPPVRDWLLRYNTRWVETKRDSSKVDLDAYITEP